MCITVRYMFVYLFVFVCGRVQLLKQVLQIIMQMYVHVGESPYSLPISALGKITVIVIHLKKKVGLGGNTMQ